MEITSRSEQRFRKGGKSYIPNINILWKLFLGIWVLWYSVHYLALHLLAEGGRHFQWVGAQCFRSINLFCVWPQTFNPACNFWFIQGTMFLFGMLIPCVRLYQIMLILSTLWPWPSVPGWPCWGHGVSQLHLVFFCLFCFVSFSNWPW